MTDRNNESTQPIAVLIAGANGAGKSSAAPDLLQGDLRVDTFVNADVIAQGLSGFRPEAAAIQAGRIVVTRLSELSKRRENFAFETTLSGRSVRQLIETLKANGYAMHIIYLWLPSVDLAVARVRYRVQMGGHNVADDVIRRRYSKSLANFDRLYRPLATTWSVYDSSSTDGRPLVAFGGHGLVQTVKDTPRWSAFMAQARAAVDR